MRASGVRFIFTIFVCLAFWGCGITDKQYSFKGRVVEKVPETHTLVIDHEDIPGFMPAMTMPYRVSRQIDLSQIEIGDKIDARVRVHSADSFELDQVHVTDTSGRGKDVAAERPLSPGEQIPDVDLVNQDAKTIRLSDFRGKAVLLTFVYTRCPMPNFCPLLSSNFAAVQKELAKNPKDYQRTHLVSISIDPKYDTPEVLHKYGLAYLRDDPSGFSHWSFTAPTPENLKKLAGAFGLLYEEEDNQIAHSMSTVVVDPKGRLVKEWTVNSWTPAEAVAVIRQAENATN